MVLLKLKLGFLLPLTCRGIGELVCKRGMKKGIFASSFIEEDPLLKIGSPVSMNSILSLNPGDETQRDRFVTDYRENLVIKFSLQKSLFNKTAGLRPGILLKGRLWHKHGFTDSADTADTVPKFADTEI